MYSFDAVLRVAVDNLDIFGTSFCPTEANAPLVVHSYAVLAQSVARQRFKSIAAQHFQLGETQRLVEHTKLAQRRVVNPRRQAPASFTAPDDLCLATPEADDHPCSLAL